MEFSKSKIEFDESTGQLLSAPSGPMILPSHISFSVSLGLTYRVVSREPLELLIDNTEFGSNQLDRYIMYELAL